MLIPQEMGGQGNSGCSIIGQGSLIGSSPYVGNTGLNTQLLNKLYNRLVEKGYAKTVFFDKKYEGDFRKFNKYLKSSKLMMDSQSEPSQKHKSDRDRSQSKERLEEELDRCFPDQPDAVLSGENEPKVTVKKIIDGLDLGIPKIRSPPNVMGTGLMAQDDSSGSQNSQEPGDKQMDLGEEKKE